MRDPEIFRQPLLGTGIEFHKRMIGVPLGHTIEHRSELFAASTPRRPTID
jgi:hypothetical protein